MTEPANLIDVGPSAGDCQVTTTELDLPAPDDAGSSRVLAEHTTFHIGGAAKNFVVATTTDELVSAVRTADEAGEPVLVLSGGSNLLVGDHGFDGTVVKVANRGLVADESDCGGAVVQVAAGENWDEFVQLAIAREWIGIEALSGIPGLVGSTPIQNVGAYGAEVAQTIYRVRTWDREAGAFKTFAASECGFAYRDSIFKRSRQPHQATGRYVVLEVTFQFERGGLSAPIAYSELARTLGVEVGARAPMAEVRDAVIALRRSKGMVVEEADHDTWSAGSFFTNPLLSADEAAALPAEAPRFPTTDGRIKTSAAWLIDHAGFGKGYGTGPARLSTKHVLALTNRGQAKASDVEALAREVADGVEAKYHVRLEPEPVILGDDWV